MLIWKPAGLTRRRDGAGAVLWAREWYGFEPGPIPPGREARQLAVETAYRPLADPSLPPRELDRQVPAKHPVAVKVDSVLQQLVKRFGGPPPPQAQTAGTRRSPRSAARRSVDRTQTT